MRESERKEGEEERAKLITPEHRTKPSGPDLSSGQSESTSLIRPLLNFLVERHDVYAIELFEVTFVNRS